MFGPLNRIALVAFDVQSEGDVVEKLKITSTLVTALSDGS